MTDEGRFTVVGDRDGRVTPIHGATTEATQATVVSEDDAAADLRDHASAKHMVMLTNHGAALLYLHAHPDARVRDVADALRITERATARILADLKTSGHLRVTHANRRNRYEVTGLLPLHASDGAARTMTDLALRLSSLTMSASAGGISVF